MARSASRSAFDAENAMDRLLLFAFSAMNVLGAALAVYDKIAAKKLPRRRIPERTLLLVGLFGGAEAMLAAMLLIRHKTRHKNFMIGLPLEIALHIAVAAAGWVAVKL